MARRCLLTGNPGTLRRAPSGSRTAAAPDVSALGDADEGAGEDTGADTETDGASADHTASATTGAAKPVAPRVTALARLLTVQDGGGGPNHNPWLERMEAVVLKL
jgi:hypothetical protein